MTKEINEIQRLILSNNDNEYNASIYRMMRRTFGYEDQEQTKLSGVSIGQTQTLSSVSFDSIQLYPQIRPITKFVGKTTLISTIYADLARTRLGNIMPIFKGEDDDRLNKLKTELFAKRVLGKGVEAGWSEDLDQAYVDSWFGIGWIRWSIEGGIVVPKHVPTLQVIYDTVAPTMKEIQWLACITYLSVEEATERYGEIAKTKIVTRGSIDYTNIGQQCVLTLEYFTADRKITFLGDFNTIVEDIPNEYGCIPFDSISMGKHFNAVRPIGRAFVAEPIIAAMNDIEDSIDATLTHGRTIIYDPKYLDWKEITDSTWGTLVKINEDGVDKATTPTGKQDAVNNAFQVIEPPVVNPANFQRYAELQRRLVEATGISPLDFGTGYQSNKTATEVNEIAAQSGALRAFNISKIREACINMIHKWVKLTHLYDIKPTVVDVMGNKFYINYPEYPAMTSRNLFSEERVIEIEIADETLGYNENALRNQTRIAQLSAALGLPGVNPIEITKEIIKLLGLDANQVLIPMNEAAMGMPNQPGNPRQQAQLIPQNPDTKLTPSNRPPIQEPGVNS